MRCFGLTKTRTRCKHDCKFIFCRQHWYQPFTTIFTFIVVIVTFYGLYDILFNEKPITPKDIDRLFEKFEVPSITSEVSFPGASIAMVLSINQQQEKRRKYVFDLAENANSNRISLFLDASNIMVFELVDGFGEKYNVKIAPNNFHFNKYFFLYCEYGYTEELSFLRVFIEDKILEQTKFKFKIDLPTELQKSLTIMSDLNGENTADINVAFYSIMKGTLGNMKRRGYYNSIRWYFKSINHPYIN